MSKSEFNRKAGIFFIAYHALLAITLPFYLLYHPPGASLLIATGVVIAITGVTLTAVYHRHYSHRAYKMHPAAEAVFLFFGTIMCQGSVFEWAFDHRQHHKYTEGEGDPHAITRGFWYAHILWILDPRPTLDERVIHDLTSNRMLQFQHRHYTALMIASCLTISLALGWISGDWLGGFYVGFLVRIFISHHATFCINSLAHFAGSKPFDRGQTAVNNPICSLITFGEGAHNYHHVFPFDYRIGDAWYHWDPGKWMIWSLDKVGLAGGLKRAPARAIERARQKTATASNQPRL